MNKLTRYECGCVGRDNIAEGAKAKAFIRVAETRGGIVETSPKNCPDHAHSLAASA